MPHRALAASLLAAALVLPEAARAEPHNVLLFIADGLRQGMATPANAPTIAGLLVRGVRFANTHSMFPTFTTANASALATGHKLGDTGDFSNTIFVGFPVGAAGGSVTPFIENDAVLGELDSHFAGDYLHEATVMGAARLAGISTASIGKLGPALVLDHTARDGTQGIVVDDATGKPVGIPLSPDLQARLKAAGLPLAAPGRGENGKPGNATTPGTKLANTAQQDWFLAVATRAVLPAFKERGRPFFLAFWSRDPDGTQHNQGDSLGHLVPGINGPTSLAAIRNADADLAGLLAALKELGLDATTDVIVTADHGFSTISKDSATSAAAARAYADVPAGALPPGFVAIDLADALGLTLFDPDAGNAAIAAGQHPKYGNGLIGPAADRAKVVVAANGGSDLIYLPDHDWATLRRAVTALAAEDYVSGLFVADEYGEVPGTLPTSAIDLHGSAATPAPAIVVNFRSFATGCADPLLCTAEVADTGLQQGQGMHGTLSRADTQIPGGAIGPDFRECFVDPAPTSNADLGRTVAHILGVPFADTGTLAGRVLAEALRDGTMPPIRNATRRSAPDEAGRRTVLQMQSVGDVRYFDAAGYPGRTVGLDE